jgi:glutathione S-transferase
MKLYTYDAAPNAQRLALFMKLKGIELDTRQVDLGSAEQLGEEYRAINPYCSVPALVLDDGTVLSEVIAQCHYLESLYPDKPLLGSNALEQALVSEWDHRIFVGATMAVADMLRNRSKAFENRALPGPVDIPQVAELVERGRLRLHGFWPGLEAHLSDRNYMVGDSLTFADIDLYCLCGFIAWVKERIPEDCPGIQAWFERVSEELKG